MKIQYFNAPVIRLTGFSQKELDKKQITKIFSESDNNLFKSEVVYLTGENFIQSRILVKTKKGIPIPVEFKITKQKLGNTEVFICTGQDQTETTQLQEKYKNLSAEYQKWLKEINNYVFKWKRDRENNIKILLSEGKIASEFDARTSKVKDMDLDKLFPENVYNFIKKYADSAFSGETVEFDLKLENRWFKTTLHPYKKEKDGFISEIIGHSEDITNFKNALENLQKNQEILKAVL